MSTSALEYPHMATPPQPIHIERQGEDLAANTVCLRVWFNMLGNSKKVKTSQVEVDADKSEVHVSKRLLNSPQLDAIRKADSQFRKDLENISVPGLDVGMRLVSWNAVERAHRMLTTYKAARQDLVEDFMAAYPELCKARPGQLRSLHNAADYLPDDVVRSKFGFSWRFINFGVPGRLEAVKSSIFSEEREKAAQDWQDAGAEVKTMLRETAHRLVAHLRDRLEPEADGKEKRLHKTAVTNLQEFFESFPLRNPHNDRELAEEMANLRNLLGDTDAKELKDKKDWREAVRQDLAKIETNLSALVENKPTRKFRLVE